jgi:excisionase family DNA binding protein
LPRETARREPSSEDAEPGSSLLDELMTAKEVADVFRLRLSTVEGYARRGLLPSVKVGRHRRFLRYQVEQALRELVEAQANLAEP